MVLTNIALCVLAGPSEQHHTEPLQVLRSTSRSATLQPSWCVPYPSTRGPPSACLPGSLPGSDLSLRMPACVRTDAGSSCSDAARDLGDRRLHHRPGGPGQRIACGNELVGRRAGRLQRPSDRCDLSRCAPRHRPRPFTAVLCGNALLRSLEQISCVRHAPPQVALWQRAR